MFLELLPCRGDDVIRKIKNALRRPIILFQLQDNSVGKLLRKTHDVFKICAPESIYTLRIVAHNHEIAIHGRERPHDRRLRPIGILIFVDENVPAPAGNRFAYVIVFFKKKESLRQQIIIIHQTMIELVSVVLCGEV